ncbi:MAG: hypothetical protein Q9187_007801 [Circinaria calcarea]
MPRKPQYLAYRLRKDQINHLAEEPGISKSQANVQIKEARRALARPRRVPNAAQDNMTPQVESPASPESEVDRGPILNEFDVVLNKTEYMVIVCRFPNRDRNQPYNAASGMKPLEIRFKPKCGLMQIDVPMDVYRNYNREKGVEYGEAMKRSKLLQKGGDYGLAGGFTGRQGGSTRAAKVDVDEETIAQDYFPGYGPEDEVGQDEDSESSSDEDKGSKGSKGSEDSKNVKEVDNGNDGEISEDSRGSEDSQGTKDDDVSVDVEVNEESQNDEDSEDSNGDEDEDDEGDEDGEEEEDGKEYEDSEDSEEYDKEAEQKNFEQAVNQGNVMNKITLEGMLEYPQDDDPVMMIGVFQGDVLHMTPVTASVWLQPVFPHLDAVTDNNKPSGRAKRANANASQDSEAQAVNMTFASADSDEEELGPNAGSTAKLLKEIEEEPWTRLEWVDEDDPRAYAAYYNEMMLPEPVQKLRLRTAVTKQEYMDAISAPRFDPTTRSMKKMSNKLPEDSSDTDSDEKEDGDEGDWATDQEDGEGDEEEGAGEDGRANGEKAKGTGGEKG